MEHYEAIKDKINKIFEEEMEEIKCDSCDEGEDEFSHNIRKMHYKAEAKALRLRLNKAFAPQPVTAHYEPADDNGPELHYYECPGCYSNIAAIHDSTAWTKKFCPYCGQPLDWSDLAFTSEVKICEVKKPTNLDRLKRDIQSIADKYKKMTVEEFASRIYFRSNLFSSTLECPFYMEGECDCTNDKQIDSECKKRIIEYLKEEVI